MPDFRFELESLLSYRRHQLDQCRQLMAEILADQSRCHQQKDELKTERESVITQIREKNTGTGINIQTLAASRYYMAQLDGQSRGLDQQLARTAQQLELCRRAVLQADMAVKALEQLREKRFQKYCQQEIKREELMLQESWLASSHQNSEE